jgi:arsenate reductase (glutaredoxin)
MTSDTTIYHNPACGTSRNTLAMIRAAGIEPTVIEYLKTPPSRPLLEELVARSGRPARDLLRAKEPLAAGLEAASDAAILDAMMAHPVLINRPLVVSPRGVRLCRPSEHVLGLLPEGPQAPFTKEDGAIVPGREA